MNRYQAVIYCVDQIKGAIEEGLHTLPDLSAKETVLEEIAAYIQKLIKKELETRHFRGGPNDR